MPLGIAAQNLVPDNPSLDARPLFQAALQYVQSHPVFLLTLDHGNYYFLTDQAPPFIGRVIPSLSNMTIDLAGSTLWFSDPQAQGFDVYYCTNLVLTNFTTDFLNPPYAHATLTSVDTTNRILHYSTISGFPDPASFSQYATADEQTTVVTLAFRNGQIVPGTSRMPVQPPIANGAIPLFQDGAPWTQSAALSTLQPGDTIVVTWRGGQPRVVIWNGNGVTLSNANVYGSSGWAIQADESANTTVDQVRILPRPGFGLIGSDADGIHFNNVGPNDHIRNSYVTRTLDDALVMDSLALASVVSQPSPQQMMVQRSGFLRFPNGTAVDFVDPVSTLESPGATIISQSPGDSQSPTFRGQVTLTFDRAVPAVAAGTEVVMASPAHRGAGSTIEDNTVEDLPFGRGIWIGGSQRVTIQRNVIRHSSEAGVALAEDTVSFPGPPVQNITMQNNALESVLGPMAEGIGAQDSIAAVMALSTGQHFLFSSSSTNANIAMLNNYIADSGRGGIWLGETDGANIAGNLIVRWYQHPELPIFGIGPSQQQQVLQDITEPIVVR